MFAQTSANHTPISPFIILSKTESTNNYAMAKLHAGMLDHGTAVMALVQTSGKGQRGKKWLVQPSSNITMSTAFSLQTSMRAEMLTTFQSFPFLFSATMALGCYDFIKGFTSADTFIKWPNDVYLNDRKAAGILIENIYRSGVWTWAIAGIGVNVNQTDFPDLANNPTSIAIVTGQQFDLRTTGLLLHYHLLEKYYELIQWSPADIMREYNSRLYLRGKTIVLRKNNVVLNTMIESVDMHGRLVTNDAITRTFNVGEVEFV